MQHMQCRVLVLVAKSGNGVQQQRARRQSRRVVWPRAAYPPLLTRCLQFHNMVVGCSWYHNHTSAAGVGTNRQPCFVNVNAGRRGVRAVLKAPVMVP